MTHFVVLPVNCWSPLSVAYFTRPLLLSALRALPRLASPACSGLHDLILLAFYFRPAREIYQSTKLLHRHDWVRRCRL